MNKTIKQTIAIEKNDNGVSTIILNQPDKHNALSPKMIEAVRKNMKNPKYNLDARAAKLEKLTPIVEKINMVLHLAESKNDKAVGFVQKVKDYVREN